MSNNFDLDHNRLFGLLEETLRDDKVNLHLEANGGNSILFAYPNEEDSKYVAEAKRRFRDSAIFVDVAETLTDYQEEIGPEEFKELEKDLGIEVYYRKGATDTFFEYLVARIASAAAQGMPVFLIGTSAIVNKGFSNINIMEHKAVKTAMQPLVYFYPSVIEGEQIYFLGDKNHPASKYRCRIIK